MLNLSILIVDDDNVVRNLIQNRLLKEHFAKLDVAKDGLAAKKLLQTKQYDVVLTDLIMYGGIDGIELLEVVKETNSATEVIVITAHSSVDSAVEAMKKGAFDYLKKPVNFDELLLRLDKIATLKNIVKYAQDIEQAKEVTESAASETIQRMEIHIAALHKLLDQSVKLLSKDSIDSNQRINEVLHVIGSFKKQSDFH